jgi:intraflagellar transport protein 122
VAEGLHANSQIKLATEMYRKLGEEASVIGLHVEAKNWTEAFSLAQKLPQYKHLVYIPYAEWLAENDKFVEAQKGKFSAKSLLT